MQHTMRMCSLSGSTVHPRQCMPPRRPHTTHCRSRTSVVIRAVADPTTRRRPPPVSTLKDPAHIGARTTKNASVDESTQHTLDEYMRLPVEQYYELDPTMIKPLGGDCFQLAVPRIQLFNVWLEPVVQVYVQQAPGKVIIEATECTLNGSDIVASLNQRFEMRFTTNLTWDSPALAAATSTTTSTTTPVALQPQQQRAPTRGTIFADLDLNVWCEVIPPFNLLPREGVLEPTVNAVLGTLVNGLLPVFVRKLGADYERWAQDEGYRARRAALSSSSSPSSSAGEMSSAGSPSNGNTVVLTGGR